MQVRENESPDGHAEHGPLADIVLNTAFTEERETVETIGADAVAEAGTGEDEAWEEEAEHATEAEEEGREEEEEDGVEEGAEEAGAGFTGDGASLGEDEDEEEAD